MGRSLSHPSDHRLKAHDSQPRLVAFLNSYTEGMSGGDACFIEIAKRLKGIEIIVVTSLLGCMACRSRGLECEFWITTRERKFGTVIFTYTARLMIGVRLTLRIRRGDIIYVTSDFLPDVLPALAGKIRLQSCIWAQKSFHLIPASRPVPHLAQRLSHILIRAKADMVVAGNALLREQLLRRGIVREKVRVNYPGIDADYYQTFETTSAEATIYDAAYLGRIHPSKGVFSLVDIWQTVNRQRPSSRLVIIGRGDLRTTHDLERRIAAAGLQDQITLLGYLESTAAVRALRRSRVFAFPSPEEGFGMAILEAIASGLPVVAWDLPVYREVFPQGILRVPTGNHQSFADAIVAILTDPDLLARLVAEGRHLPALYDWQRIAAREKELLLGTGVRG